MVKGIRDNGASGFVSVATLTFSGGCSVIVIFNKAGGPLIGRGQSQVGRCFRTAGSILILSAASFGSRLATRGVRRFGGVGGGIMIITLGDPARVGCVTSGVFSSPALTRGPILVVSSRNSRTSLGALIGGKGGDSACGTVRGLGTQLGQRYFLSVATAPRTGLLVSALSILSPSFNMLISPNGKCYNLSICRDSGGCAGGVPSGRASLLSSNVPRSFVRTVSVFFITYTVCGGHNVGPKSGLSVLIRPDRLGTSRRGIFGGIRNLVGS